LGITKASVDDLAGSRYSLAQIKDLVAYTIPRFHRTVVSSGSRLGCVAGKLLDAVAIPLSFEPSQSNVFTHKNLYKTLPGGPENGLARSISPLDRLPGGY
jgi:hypothetical protein